MVAKNTSEYNEKLLTNYREREKRQHDNTNYQAIALYSLLSSDVPEKVIYDYKPSQLSWMKVACIRESKYNMLDLIAIDYDGLVDIDGKTGDIIGLRQLIDEIETDIVSALLCVPSIDYLSQAKGLHIDFDEKDNVDLNKSINVLDINSFDTSYSLVPGFIIPLLPQTYGCDNSDKIDDTFSGNMKYINWKQEQEWIALRNYIDWVSYAKDQKNRELKTEYCPIWDLIENPKYSVSMNESGIQHTEDLYREIAAEDFEIGIQALKYIVKVYPDTIAGGKYENVENLCKIIDELVKMLRSRRTHQHKVEEYKKTKRK